MNFCLLINASPEWRQSVDSALLLATAMLNNGHQVNTVFFYGAAVKIVQCDERLQAWRKWQRQAQAKLQLCSTLIEQQQLEKCAQSKLAMGFEVVGLASWIQASEAADRLVELS